MEDLSTWKSVMWTNFSTWQIFFHRVPPEWRFFFGGTTCFDTNSPFERSSEQFNFLFTSFSLVWDYRDNLAEQLTRNRLSHPRSGNPKGCSNSFPCNQAFFGLLSSSDDSHNIITLDFLSQVLSCKKMSLWVPKRFLSCPKVLGLTFPLTQISR